MMSMLVRLFTPTAGQYFRDEQCRRHSQYDGGTRLAELEEISYGSGVIPQVTTASSFQSLGQRFKGKNALVFYSEGSPTIAGALSQDMDISVDQTQIMLRDKLTLNLQLAFLNTSSPTHWVTPLPRHIGPDAHDAGKAAAAKDAAAQKDGGIWDGTQNNKLI
ncbi:meiosis mei2 [Fusarium mundagurra]|uniref:Meiosis mei2 n=1 Tax=Fusarium mundagurra TaxID=1567541 RepID=A0A8H5Z9H2_9HYPO|nr:meiosis mei2 [Fusarium mundagurra]